MRAVFVDISHVTFLGVGPLKLCDMLPVRTNLCRIKVLNYNNTNNSNNNTVCVDISHVTFLGVGPKLRYMLPVRTNLCRVKVLNNNNNNLFSFYLFCFYLFFLFNL